MIRTTTSRKALTMQDGSSSARAAFLEAKGTEVRCCMQFRNMLNESWDSRCHALIEPITTEPPCRFDLGHA